MRTRASIVAIIGMVALQSAVWNCFADDNPQQQKAATGALPAAPPEPSRPVKLSSWAAELARLAEGGIEETVLQAFIDCAGTFNLDSSQIIYLRDIGVSSETISAVLRHDFEIGTGLRQMSASAVAPAPPPLELKLMPRMTLGPADERTETTTPEPKTSGLAVEIPDDGRPGIAVPVNSDPELEWWAPPAGPKPLGNGLSPVRHPYPVELTDPIIVYRGSGRTANVVLVATPQ